MYFDLIMSRLERGYVISLPVSFCFKPEPGPGHPSSALPLRPARKRRNLHSALLVAAYPGWNDPCHFVQVSGTFQQGGPKFGGLWLN